jgi:RNA polymerase sigma-70 factor (ECF subfamily)
MGNLHSRSAEQDFHDLFARARAGDKEAIGLLINEYRAYLLKIAHSEGDERLQAKEGDSDLVQETCWKAQRVFSQFKGESRDELRAWLRRILRRQIGDQRDRYLSGKRNVYTETPLIGPDEADSRNDKLATHSASPSENLMKKEEHLLVEIALQSLRDTDRSIIEMRQREGFDFVEIGRRLSMTEDAVRKRWHRALELLREKFERLQ